MKWLRNVAIAFLLILALAVVLALLVGWVLWIVFLFQVGLWWWAATLIIFGLSLAIGTMITLEDLG